MKASRWKVTEKRDRNDRNIRERGERERERERGRKRDRESSLLYKLLSFHRELYVYARNLLFPFL
jgi:hypothetical protein